MYPADIVEIDLQTPGLNIITEYIMGIIYPGRPIANVCFKVYGYMSMAQAVSFLSDFKLGHYMKIPPRSMFLVQVDYIYILSKNATIKALSSK